MKKLNAIIVIVLAMACAVPSAFSQKKNQAKTSRDTVTLPPPYATKSKMNFSKVQGWKSGRLPSAPEVMIVNRFADGFENPRWTYVAPNGDILVAESNGHHTFWERVAAPIVGASKSNNLRHSADRITILRDANHDGTPEMRQQFLGGLNQPFGMLILKDLFYVANTDGLWRFPYKEGAVGITGKGEKILDLPAGKHNRHWTRNIIANKNGTKIYIAVGSGSNVAENGMLNEILRADILEIDPDGTNMKIYASGLRNPVGMGWAPGTNTLWTVVNERDELGDDLVPDYLTSVQEEGFYGWPFTYYGEHVDERVKDRPATAHNAIVPDVALGAHTASLGLAFCTSKTFPEKYQNGAFIAQHGSWNRSNLSGYKVVFVPFKNGKPSGKPEDFLTGFMADIKKDKVYGRPVGITLLHDGSMIITDDVNGVIWRVAASAATITRK